VKTRNAGVWMDFILNTTRPRPKCYELPQVTSTDVVLQVYERPKRREVGGRCVAF